jgi:hypothetical protein
MRAFGVVVAASRSNGRRTSHKRATKEGHPPERSALKSTLQQKPGQPGVGGVCRPAATEPATGPVAVKKFSEKWVERLTVKEVDFLLGVIAEHREYYRVLAGSRWCSELSRDKHEALECLGRKLEAMR